MSGERDSEGEGKSEGHLGGVLGHLGGDLGHLGGDLGHLGGDLGYGICEESGVGLLASARCAAVSLGAAEFS